MPRILFFVFLAFLFWLLIRMLGGSRKRDDADAARRTASIPPATPPGIETIAQCAWCGVHVPRGDATTLPDGRVYCSVAHRDAASKVATPADRGDA